jgi:NAD(P) transhydrogenase subunit beta
MPFLAAEDSSSVWYWVAELSYLVAASLFIVGIKLLGSPRTAPKGNQVAAAGMFVAILATLIHESLSPWWIIAGLVVGSAAGIWGAQKIHMTAMPQMVALLNGLGGAASSLVAWSELQHETSMWKKALLTNSAAAFPIDLEAAIPVVASVAVGAITFTGSILAYAKLQELMRGSPVTFRFQKTANAALLLALIALSVVYCRTPDSIATFLAILVVASVLGVLAVLPIGGADMPVVISLLNSYSGIAASATGFVLKNNALIISGALVGASGIILTQIMCKAMNRSLANVLFGAFGGLSEAPAGGTGPGGGSGAVAATVKSTSADEVALLLDGASLVIVVPGYGMAVAQAQHAVRELASLLKAKGTTVKYAIHPVAGRMPGHMNVLLAEADVPYDQLCEMDDINPDFPQADVALVIGANDVTNPAARTDRSSPIFGMPILDVDKARTVVILKRSMKPGFAGIDNALYTQPQTLMLFGDAKASVRDLVQAVKELG